MDLAHDDWERLWRDAKTESELGDIARDLAHEIGRKGIPAVRQFLHRFGGTTEEADNDLARGFRLALVEYMEAYYSAREAFDDEVGALQLAMLCGWQDHLEILNFEGPQSLESFAGHICKKTVKPVDIEFLRQTITRMTEENLIEPIRANTPRPLIYRLSLRGGRVLEKLQEQQKWLKTWRGDKEDS